MCRGSTTAVGLLILASSLLPVASREFEYWDDEDILRRGLLSALENTYRDPVENEFQFNPDSSRPTFKESTPELKERLSLAQLLTALRPPSVPVQTFADLTSDTEPESRLPGQRDEDMLFNRAENSADEVGDHSDDFVSPASSLIDNGDQIDISDAESFDPKPASSDDQLDEQIADRADEIIASDSDSRSVLSDLLSSLPDQTDEGIGENSRNDQTIDDSMPESNNLREDINPTSSSNDQAEEGIDRGSENGGNDNMVTESKDVNEGIGKESNSDHANRDIATESDDRSLPTNPSSSSADQTNEGIDKKPDINPTSLFSDRAQEGITQESEVGVNKNIASVSKDVRLHVQPEIPCTDKAEEGIVKDLLEKKNALANQLGSHGEAVAQERADTSAKRSSNSSRPHDVHLHSNGSSSFIARAQTSQKAPIAQHEEKPTAGISSSSNESLLHGNFDGLRLMLNLAGSAPMGPIAVIIMLLLCVALPCLFMYCVKPFDKGRKQYRHKDRLVYEWQEAPEYVTLFTKLPTGLTSKSVEVTFWPRHLRIGRVGKAPFIREELFSSVDIDECTWEVSGGELIVTLYKSAQVEWPCVFRAHLPRQKAQPAVLL